MDARGEETPDDTQATFARVHDTLLELATAVDAHFGDREPSDEELRAFLRELLLGEGRSEEEADELLRDL